MAISIKNHEDRITALENKTSSSNVTYKILCNGNFSGSSFTVAEPFSNFDLILVDLYQNSSYVDMHIYSGKYPTDTGGYYVLGHVIGKFCVKVTKASWTSTTVTFTQREATIRRIIGLKLYYNFSYNIIREFYVVKFKLKHYLCSHLRNYVSNKGGVIQNGY